MKYVFFGLSLFFALSSFTLESDFQKVLNKVRDTTVKQRLQVFERSGIERKMALDSVFTADSLVAVAKTYLNTPHRMGGTSRKGIDCSGLVCASFKHFGLELPHSSHELAKYGKVIAELDELQKGDLLFFYNSYNSKNLITHTGIYLGDGQFIHTSHNSGVCIISIYQSSYWNSRFLFGTRPRVMNEVESEG